MADLRSVRRGAALLTAAAMLTLAGCGGAQDDSSAIISDAGVVDGDGMHGAVLTAPYTWPEGELVDTAGDDFDLRAGLEKPLTLVFFGYSHCPDICQAVMADLSSAVARLEDDEADDLAVWFVTTDPARDDPATLREYLDRFNPAFTGLSGPLEEIVDVAAAVHVPVEKGERLPSGGYEVTHGTPILGVTPDGEVPVLWTEGTSAAKLAEDLHLILSEGIPTPEEGT